MKKMSNNFREDLQTLINLHCMENGSDTPDSIIADYLAASLRALDDTIVAREHYWNKSKDGGSGAKEEENKMVMGNQNSNEEITIKLRSPSQETQQKMVNSLKKVLSPQESKALAVKLRNRFKESQGEENE